MALPVTSNTAAFLVSRDDIIKVALRHLKVLSIGQTPQTEDITNLSLSLNMLLKQFDTLGWLRWCYRTISFPFVAAQAAYSIAETGANVTDFRPVRIAAMWRRDSNGLDTPMFELPRSGYNMLTNKSQPGLPNQWMYDPQIGLSTVTLWPVPTDATNSGFVCMQRPIQDITGSTQNFDLEQEWFLPLGWILADEVSEDFEVDGATIQRIQTRANHWRDQVANFSREEVGFTQQPDQQNMAGSARFTM